MKKWNWQGIAACGLVAVTLAGVALAANQGTQADPLVTLSYLNNKVTPSILSQVDAKIAQREADLVNQLKQQSGGQTTDKPTTGTASSSYTVVTLTQGQQLIGKEGCEFLLRSGSATCVSDSAPGLVDMTGGTTLAPGGALVKNHLYLSTVDGRGVKAVGAVTLLVRGAYSLG